MRDKFGQVIGKYQQVRRDGDQRIFIALAPLSYICPLRSDPLIDSQIVLLFESIALVEVSERIEAV